MTTSSMSTRCKSRGGSRVLPLPAGERENADFVGFAPQERRYRLFNFVVIDATSTFESGATTTSNISSA